MPVFCGRPPRAATAATAATTRGFSHQCYENTSKSHRFERRRVSSPAQHSLPPIAWRDARAHNYAIDATQYSYFTHAARREGAAVRPAAHAADARTSITTTHLRRPQRYTTPRSASATLKTKWISAAHEKHGHGRRARQDLGARGGARSGPAVEAASRGMEDGRRPVGGDGEMRVLGRTKKAWSLVACTCGATPFNNVAARGFSWGPSAIC